MADNMTATPEQKKELTIDALKIAGFTENTEYPGMYAQINDDIKTVVDLTAGVSLYLYDIQLKCKINDGDDASALDSIKKIITEAEDGLMPTKTDADIVVNTKAQDVVSEQPDKIQTYAEPPQKDGVDFNVDPDTWPDGWDPSMGPRPTESIKHAPAEIVHSAAPAVPSDLSVSTIKKYINDKATDEEAYVFLQLCKARGLNPFLKEAYLIKYDHVSPATMVVGKDAFMKRAELHPEYDGFEAGIIVEYKDSSGFAIVDENRVGTFLREEETLLGGWAKVYRKDHTRPVEITVSMKEFNTGKSSWKKIPATMIRKVALVQGHREAFPSELSGMYDQSEIGVEVST